MTSREFNRVLITGGSRGIGKQISEDFKSRGFSVQTPTRDILDLGDALSIDEFLESCPDVDILILNAGQNNPQSLDRMSLQNWQATMMTNVTSSMTLTRYFAPKMAANGFGRVVAISSAYATRARAGRAAYSASKAALEALIRHVAVEFAEQGVIANSIAPGFVLTDLTRQNNDESQIAELAQKIPLKRLASPSEISYWVSALTSKENTYLTGQTIHVDGGLTCL
jgi:3-oxoacyl-[acyl-carrier protein] reductase